MSLINDMLRDLEQRREQDKQQKPVSSPAAVTKKFARQRLPLMAGALVLLLLAAGWAYYLPKEPATPFHVSASDADEVLTVAQSEMATTKAVALKSDPLPADNPLLTSVNLVESTQHLQLELTFDLLPARAEIRSTPKEGQLLIRLPGTYLQQGLLIPQPKNEKVSNISLVPTSAGLDLIVALATGQQIAFSQHLEPHSSKLVIGLDFPALTSPLVEAIADPDGKVETTTALSQSAPVAPVSTPVAAPAPALVRTQPLPETDEQLYQRGLQQVRQGDLRAAQENLTAAVRINPEKLPARLELIGVLQRLADEQEALRVIQKGLQLQPAQPELRKLFAHHLLHLQRHQDAQTLLQTAPLPAVAADPDYHALRAAIYQELGEYPQAAQLYARLLEQRPREPLWWLGLAIALDQQGLSAGARDAYRTALDVSGLRPDLEKYVRERLQHL